MRIGLIDVDGKHFPNLALMRISAYHKQRGDTVEWWWTDFVHYDIVYKSKVFSSDYTKDIPDPLNADVVIKGGTGYAISKVGNREVFDTANHSLLPPEIEAMQPDYSIYAGRPYALSMTSQGCPRNCGFCHVTQKEGCRAVKVANVREFWSGQQAIKVLDPNITACPDKRDLMKQYVDTGAVIDFTQGLDIRLLNEDDISDINRMRLSNIHFAWDNPKDDLQDSFSYYTKRARHRPHGEYGSVYILTNLDSTLAEDLHRIYTVRDLGYAPFVMVYDKPNAPLEVRRLQRWCNNRKIFKSCPRFEDYEA